MSEAWDIRIQDDLEEVERVMMGTINSGNPELTEMCNYVLRNHGKRIRPAMCILSYCACGGEDVSKPVKVGAALEIIHNATLVHDDINDEAELRRGKKPLYKEYSLSKSIVTGDFLLAVGFQLIGSSSRSIVDYIVDAATSMGVGEFNQQDFEHKCSVTESDYIRIINGKTAKFMECSAKCGAYLAGASLDHIEVMGNFAVKLGMAFQIIDDVLDVIGDKNATGKPTGNDIFEGKPTLPTIYGMQDPIHGSEIMGVFNNEKPTPDEVSRAIELIKSTDSIERCRNLAESIVDEAVELLYSIPDSDYKKSLIMLAEYIVSRDR